MIVQYLLRHIKENISIHQNVLPTLELSQSKRNGLSKRDLHFCYEGLRGPYLLSAYISKHDRLS